MGFDQDTIRIALSDTAIKPLPKLVLLALSQYDDQTVQAEQLLFELQITKANLIKSVQSLIESKIMFNGTTLKGLYNQQEFQVNVSGVSFGIVRRPHLATVTDKARLKLDQMRLIGFIGTDGLIAKLSKDYDKLLTKHSNRPSNRPSMSLPPNFHRAVQSKNWIHFKRLHQLLVDKQFPTLPYLEAQFKSMQSNGKAGKVYPYPGMLYSTWAINNYLDVVKDHLARETSENLFLDQDELIREVMQSSMIIVAQLMESNPELSFLQALILCQDSVSPVYLAIHTDYPKFLIKYDQEIPETVLRILVRFERDTQFKQSVQKIHDLLLKETNYGS